MHKQKKDGAGFTIVELLIVVVVIAILAAISAVAYTNFQRRASNAVIVNAASMTYRLVKAYVASNDSYPLTTSGEAICVTVDSGCKEAGGRTYTDGTTFDTNIATIGSPPRSVRNPSADNYGIVLIRSGQTLNGTPQPLLLQYYLSGNNQRCSLDNVVTYTWPDYTLSTTGFSSNLGGDTLCWISVPGPAA